MKSEFIINKKKKLHDGFFKLHKINFNNIPKCKNNKLENLYYIGQLTVPGPGVPPAIVSGKIVANLIHLNH